MYFPEPKSEFLKDFVFSVKKRHKALKNKCSFLKCERIIVKDHSADLEVIELEIIKSARVNRMPLKIDVWEDRWLWVDARRWADNAWLWEWSLEGRVLPENDGKILIETIEKTMALSSAMRRDNLKKFDSIWSTKIATGPKKILT